LQEITTMDGMQKTDDEQVRLWNGTAGQAWVESQDLIEEIYRPLETLLADRTTARSRSQVLDVGCGTGSTTVAIARRLDQGGSCTGIDISEPMIAAARATAERERVPVRFILGSAQTYPFESATFDAVVSRFGVMFFDDPVGAFANLNRAARDGAELCLIVWRSAAENPFMTTAERAAAPLLPNLPPRRPDAPGQFAFANAARVHAILDASGWTGTEIRPVDVECTFPENALVRYLTRLGPVGLALRDEDEPTRARIVDAIIPAFDAYVRGGEVRFTAACWMVTARAAAAVARHTSGG
jgi:SAM-dependent methyltransferase